MDNLIVAAGLGQQAYLKGIKVPSADKSLVTTFQIYFSRQEGRQLIRAWLNGWHNAKIKMNGK